MNSKNKDINSENSLLTSIIINNKSFINLLLYDILHPFIVKIIPYLILYFCMQFIIIILLVFIIYNIKK